MSAPGFTNLIAFLSGRRWSQAALLAQLPFNPVADPLLEALVAGRSNTRRRPTQQDRLRARAIRDIARATGRCSEAVSELMPFVRDYPATEEFQKIIARLLHEMHDEERAFSAWLGISLRFPRSMDAFHGVVILSRRRGGSALVRAILKARFPRRPNRLDQLLAYAEACDLAGATSERRAAFERLAGMFAKRSESWLLATAWLEEEYGLNRSLLLMLRRVAAAAGLAPPIVQERPRIGLPHVAKSAVASVRALTALFDRVIESRQVEAACQGRRTGAAVLLTGSLGAGGAERQLVTTAIGLKQMNLEQRTLRDGLVLDPIHVVARSLRDRQDGAFYLSDLQRAGVEVRAYREFPDFARDLSTSSVRPALSALGLLPWSTAEAVIKLTDWLRATNPAVVHIWQDGLVYAAGFAALLAGVPRIILSGRSAPPPDRREQYLIEYDVIYRSLLRAPGVKLSVNSRHAASRYAAWLDIEPRQITVIPNGVARLSMESDAESVATFEAFAQRVGPASITLGAVMRLDEVKRPLLWIETAASLLGRLPDARIIVVGDGPFRSKVEKRTVALGVAARCLFVGRSSYVGYWLSKMDALLLLSEHEGLPNALIEAQLAGVPVITTAAGGAPEALVPGRTGFVTSLHPSPGEVADLIAGTVAQPGRLKKMSIEARLWAERAFPVSSMLSKTLELYSAAGQAEPLSSLCSTSKSRLKSSRP